ncbi:hypothetical protein BC833DRAFT_529238 [Globomyces pollinis-pini]|nr:hypothetical protein BC833DRAFT_529238 [Globomyces pollinis-pini]
MDSQESKFQAFENYDFANDNQYQEGLRTLKKQDDLPLRYFYYTKFHDQFDLNNYNTWKESLINKVNDEPKALTFNEIMELVQSGKEVPGIRTIPNICHTDGQSHATLIPKKKPWELSE